MDEMRINENVALAISAMNGSDTTGNTTDMTTFDATASTISDSAKYIVTTVANVVTDMSATGIDSMWDNLLTTTTTALPSNCRQIEVNCTKTSTTMLFNKTLVTSLAFLATTILPEILTRLNVTPSSTYDYFDSNSSSMATMNDTIYDWWDGNSSTPITFLSSTIMDFENFTEGNDLSTMLATGTTTTTTEIPSSDYDDDDDEDYAIDVVAIETTKKPAIASTTTTTSKSPPSYDDYLEEVDYSDGTRRRKRDTANMFDEIELYGRDIDAAMYNVANETWYDGNITDFISTTIASFMENNTITIDDWNTTEVSDMWTTYVNNIDESTWITDDISTTASSDDDDVLDDNAGDDSKICYEIVCDPSDSTIDIDYTTINSDRTTVTDAPTMPFTCPTLPTLPAVVAAIESSVNASKKKYIGQNLTSFINHMELSQQMNLRKLCWETMFGQELVKLTVMDLVSDIQMMIMGLLI